ncbi:MAG: hypothetical protein AB1758_15880 [Candidatus Eremiobacterota bacterium]
MIVQSFAPHALTKPRASGGQAPAPEPELPKDAYRPFSLGRTAARVATGAAPFALAGAGYLAATQLSGWGAGIAGAVIGLPVGLTVGLVLGGAADLIRSIGGRKAGKLTVISTLLGAAVTGGLGAYLAVSGHSWAVPALAGMGFLEGLAIAGIGRLATREKPTEARRLYEQVLAEPQKYHRATPTLDTVYALERKGWKVDDSSGSILSHAESPSPALTVNLAGKNGSWNAVPVEQLKTVQLLEEGGALPRPELLKFLEDNFNKGHLLASGSSVRGAGSYGVPGPEDKQWWLAERVKAYHDLEQGRAIHLCHKEISFTYDPAAAPPMEEFLEDAQATRDAYETAFRQGLDQGWLARDKAQALCERMVELHESGAYPDMASAGQALSAWGKASSGKGYSSENTRALLSLTDPNRLAPQPEVIHRLLDQLTPTFGLEGVERVADHLRLKGAGTEDRFIRLSKALGDLPQSIRLDSILSTVSPEAYDSYVSVCEQLSAGGQRKPQELLADFAVLAAYSSGPDDIGLQARDFSRIYKPLAELNQADEAAPAFAFLRQSGTTPEQFLAALEQSKDAHQAIQALAPSPSGAPADPSTVPHADVFREALNYDARDAVSHLEQVRGRLDAPSFERYRDAFIRVVQATRDLPTAVKATAVLQNLQPALAERHLKVLEGLQKQRGQAGPEVLLDYLCVVAGRAPKQNLEDAARDYGELLDGVSQLGLPDEAAPTFALIRHAQVHGKAQGASTRELTERYLKSLLLTKDGEKSRQALFVVDSGKSGVKEDEQGVVVGGVRIKRRR